MPDFNLYRANVIGDQQNCKYPHTVPVGDEESLRRAVWQDYVAVEYKGGYRSGNNFVRTNCLALDCDNDYSDNPEFWATPEIIMQVLPDVTVGFHFSRHNNLPKEGKSARPRFHCFFRIDEMTDASAYSALKKRINSLFPYFDTKALDAARFFFGTEDPEVMPEVVETWSCGTRKKKGGHCAGREIPHRIILQEICTALGLDEIDEQVFNEQIDHITVTGAKELTFHFLDGHETVQHWVNTSKKAYFDARTKIHLRRYLDERNDDNPALFVTLQQPHARLKISGVEIRLRQLGRKLEIPRVHPHKFRRTLATVAIDKGMPVEQVQQLLGHSKIDTTMHYAMVNQNNVKESHRRFIC